MKLRTQSQELAEYAVDCVRNDVLKENSDVRKRYKSYISSFPAFLISEGLVLTLAFTLSKATPSEKEPSAENKARFLVFKHVVNWLKRKEIIDLEVRDNIKQLPGVGGDVIESLSKDIDLYRLASNEALKVADWLKRITEGLIEEEIEEEKEGGD